MFHPITQEHLVGYRQNEMLKEAACARLIRRARPAKQGTLQEPQLPARHGTSLWELARSALRFAPVRG